MKEILDKMTIMHANYEEKLSQLNAHLNLLNKISHSSYLQTPVKSDNEYFLESKQKNNNLRSFNESMENTIGILIKHIHRQQ
jgi:hypothetical protein